MNVLLTGANGYIGKRLLPLLVERGNHVYCCVRDKSRFSPPESLLDRITVLELDLMDADSLDKIPDGIDAAYYLVHSMSSSADYREMEQQCAINFRGRVNKTKAKHVIYLSGMINEDELSEHLLSRKNVEDTLESGAYHFTCFRAGIIVGSGSASFEIIRDLVEKLPVMITPKWLLTRCQPIGIADVLDILVKGLRNKDVYDQNFDIGSEDVLTYKEMLLQFAEVRGLKRRIWTVPVMTPRLSSYWLYFVTSTSYRLASSLVDSMKVEVVCRDLRINEILGVSPMSYKEAISRAFKRIQDNNIVSSWKDSYVSSGIDFEIGDFINVPQFGTFLDKRKKKIVDKRATIERIWQLGGDNGWYYGNWLWRFRGLLDKAVGGVGLRRGRTNPNTLNPGDALDFWRVLYANNKEGRLLLFAEMKLPGEAWLEFKIEDGKLVQTATFRPRGLAGRIYWYLVYPFHGFIFSGMLKRLVQVT
ncbi:MAG: SDR family oxidoreductase [Fluviicola sp.]